MAFFNNIAVWKDTIKQCEYMMSKDIIPYVSTKYDFTDIQIIKKFKSTEIQVINIDSIKCGETLLKNGYNPVVLNLADDRFPGGHVDMGSGAQEESLFRRTNYFQTLNLKSGFYPLNGSQLVYSPKITVLKDDKNNDLSKFYELAFIACPGLHDPDLVDGGLSQSDIELLKNKIRNILNISFQHNHDVPILGALGCGAWRCKPNEIAQIFKNVIAEYDGAFKAIVFAVLEVNRDNYIVQNRDRTESNFEVFKHILMEKNSTS
jgi:uncharacterized protein (TIGR02452 family)